MKHFILRSIASLFAFLVLGLFGTMVLAPIHAQDTSPELDAPMQQRSLSTTHYGHGPNTPPEKTDAKFVTDQGGYLDQYLYRYEVPNHRLSFDIEIDRYYSPMITDASTDPSTGFLSESTVRSLIESKLLPETATLFLLVYDVDHESLPCPEIDHVFINNVPILDPLGNMANLTSGDSRWSTWSISIPIGILKFPTAAGIGGNRPVPASNRVEVEIDTTDCGQGNDYWAIEVDWGAIEIASPIRPFVLVHGWTGNANGFTEPTDGFYNLLYRDGIPVAEPVTFFDGIGATAETALQLEREITETAAEFGVDKINLVGHSKGGLFARWALRHSDVTRKKVERLITLATPNHGINISEELGAKVKCELTFWNDEDKKNSCKSAVNDMIEDVMISVNYSSDCRRNWPWAPWEWISCEPSYFEYLHRVSPTPNAQPEPQFLSFVGDILGIGDLAVTKTSATFPWMADNIPLPNTHNVTRVFSFTDHGTIKQDRGIYECVLSYIDQTLYPRSSCPFFSARLPQITTANTEAALSVIYSEEYRLTAGQSRISQLLISDASSIFQVMSAEPVSFHLIDPTGRTIDDAEASASLNITHTTVNESGVWMQKYEVTEAVAGSWQAVVASGFENYVGLMVQAESSVIIVVGAEHGAYHPGEPVQLYATLLDGQTTIPASAVTGTVSYSTTVFAISFRDDGTNGDDTGGDGVHTAQFAAPEHRGLVLVEVIGQILGTRSTGMTESASIRRIGNTSFSVAAQTATLQPGIYEETPDLDGNGLFDNLTINVPVNSQVAGDFYVTGRLVDIDGQTVASASYSSRDSGQGQLAPGAHVFPLLFDGQTIRQHGVNGPFAFTDIKLHDQTGGDYVVDSTVDVYDTAGYPSNAFEGTALSIVSGSDGGIDTTGNGKFDHLKVLVNLNVLFPGDYSWNARLVDGDGVEIGWFVGAGWLDNATPMEFLFDASRIAVNAEDGPYLLRDLSVYQTSGGNTSATIERVYTTNLYRYLDFEGALPQADFEAKTIDVIEDEGQVTITVTLNTTPTSNIDLTFATEDGIATAGADYTAVNGAITIPAGQTNAIIVIPIYKDSLPEIGETFLVRLTASPGILIGRNNPVIVRILDFGPPSSVSVSANPSVLVADGVGISVINANVQDAFGNSVIGQAVAFDTSMGNIDETAFTDSDGMVTVTLTAGFQAGVATVTAVASSVSATTQVAFVLPEVRFTNIGQSISENAGQANVEVNLSIQSGVTVSVEYAIGGNALATTAAGQLSFAPGETTQSFAISIVDDTFDEADETIPLTLLNPVNATLGAMTVATLTVVDDDPPPTVQFSSAAYSATENAGQIVIPVNLSAPSGFTVTVEYATGGNALGTNAVGQLSFAPGETTQSFVIPVTDNSLDGADELIPLSLRAPVNATLGAPSLATLTVMDDDPPPTVQFSSAAYSATENAGRIVITVNLSAPSGFTVTVEYSAGDDAAQTVAENAITSGTLVYAPGETEKSFSVPILDDIGTQQERRVNLVLTTPVNATLGELGAAVLTILDVIRTQSLYLPVISK